MPRRGSPSTHGRHRVGARPRTRPERRDIPCRPRSEGARRRSSRELRLRAAAGKTVPQRSGCSSTSGRWQASLDVGGTALIASYGTQTSIGNLGRGGYGYSRGRRCTGGWAVNVEWFDSSSSRTSGTIDLDHRRWVASPGDVELIVSQLEIPRARRSRTVARPPRRGRCSGPEGTV